MGRAIYAIAVSGLALGSIGCAPKSFVQSAPGWKIIELRAGLIDNYDNAWQTTVDTVARAWDIEILDKDSGYLRTAWIYGISGGSYRGYRGRITVKYPDVKSPHKVDVKTSAEWWGAGTAQAPIWVKGFDKSWQRDVYAELSGRLGRTVPAE